MASSEQANPRRWLQLAVGLGLSAFFLYLALAGEDWGAIGRELAAANYFYLFTMMPVGVYALYVRCQRWRLLVEAAAGRPCEMTPIFSASAIGFMANMVLPFRVGEFIRPYLVSRHTEISLSTVLATVVVERVLDLVALFAFALMVIAWADVPDLVRQLTWVAGGVAAVGMVGAWIVVIQRERLVPQLDRIWRRLPEKIGGFILRLEHEFLDGMSSVADGWLMAKAIAWSFYVWAVIAFSFALGFLALGIDVPFFSGGVTTATLVALAVSIPSAPAFVGQFEWGCKLALEQIYHVDGARAVGYAVLVHVTQFLTQVLLGLVYLVREGLSFKDLGSMESDADVRT